MGVATTSSGISIKPGGVERAADQPHALAAPLAVHRHHVEPYHGPPPKAGPDVRRRRPDQSRLLLPSDGLLGAAVPEVAAVSHFDEAQDAAVPRHEVELVAPRPHVATHNPIAALGQQLFGGGLFFEPSGLMRRRHAKGNCTGRASTSYNRRVKPLISITVDEGTQPRGDAAFPAWVLKRAYTDAVARAGGVPLLVAPGADPVDVVEAVQGVVVTGGAFDLPPEWSGADPRGRIDHPRPERSTFERALLQAAQARGRPVLGICGGMQLMVVMAGGRLVGDLRTERPDFGEHEQPTSPETPFHAVDLVPGTWLHAAVGRGSVPVNSTHHQGVTLLPPGLRALATDGGLIEACDDGTPEWVGVQWHPELLDDDLSRALYANLIRAARRSSAR